MANKDVSVALCGFTRMEQFVDNVGALKMLEKWTPEIEARVNAALDNTPEPEINFRERCPIPNRRTIQLYTAKK